MFNVTIHYIHLINFHICLGEVFMQVHHETND